MNQPNRLPLQYRLRQISRRYRRTLGWAVLGCAVIVAFVLGMIGFQKNLAETDEGKEYSVSTLAFLVLQMLVLNSGAAAEPVGWELETARILAVVAFFGTILKASEAVFRRQVDVLRVRMLSKHVVICGADATGTRLTTDLLAEGKRVVVMERDAERDLDKLRELGAFVLISDATHAAALEKAGVARARRVMITCGDDATNIQIAAAAGELCRRGTRLEPVTIHTHCEETRLFGLLESPTTERVEFRRFDAVLNAARLLLEEHPLDYLPITPDSQRIVQLVLLGFSRESECMLIQLARLGHYANLCRPRVLVVAADAADCEQRLRFRFPQIDNILQLEFVARDVEHAATMADVVGWLNEPEALSTMLVSPRNEDASLSIALGLPQIVADRDVPVFVRLSHCEELASLLTQIDRRPRLLPFGSLIRAGSVELVVQEKLDEQAKAIHADYVRRREAEKKRPADFPAMRPWHELSEAYREANRDQADHISVKLRAVHCEAVPTADTRPAVVWTDTEIEALSRMEHQRWNANRWLNGWRRGPRNDAQKTHPNLAPWEELDEATREYDRDAIRQISELLALVGKRIVRKSGVSEVSP